LENLWLGSGLTNIANRAFSGCTALETVSPTATTAPTLAADAFSDNTYTSAQLLLAVKETDSNYEAVKASYQSTDNNWIKFTGAIKTGVNEVSSDNVTVKSNGMTIEIAGNEGAVVSIYNMSGVKIYNGNDNNIEMSVPGVYVVTVNGKSYKVAVK
jgi:hypothetical protein